MNAQDKVTTITTYIEPHPQSARGYMYNVTALSTVQSVSLWASVTPRVAVLKLISMLSGRPHSVHVHVWLKHTCVIL